MSDSASFVEGLKGSFTGKKDGDGRKTALVTGSVALGAVLTSSLFRRIRQLRLKASFRLSSAFDAETGEMEIMEGRARFYHRSGSGVPIVLLHSIHLAASSHEMKPVFEHLTRNTRRPVYALDWFGFGRSDRAPVRYSPELYQRQLRRFLSEHVGQPADVVALLMGSEYAAEIARSLPYLIHRLVLISPTGFSRFERKSSWPRTLISLGEAIGLFEIFFYRLTRPELLRSFYQQQFFDGSDIPEELIEYARESTLIHGAHHAPRHFAQGKLATGGAPYVHVRVPTLIVAPERDQNLAHRFDELEEVAARNPAFLHVRRAPGGLMPQWTDPARLFEALDSFIVAETEVS